MKWKKRGKIFDPTEHELPNHCHEYAQSPQVLIFDEFVRIYFSTRARDQRNGKYISHIAYVDMDKSFRHIINVSKEPVIELGGLGCFDEHGIFPMNVVRHQDTVLAYTCGWSRRVSVSVETGIGLAISHDDGKSFKKYGNGPIMSSSLTEPFLVGDPFVKIYNDVFHMWYMYGTEWKSNEAGVPERIYKIGHATSDDGVSWVREGKQLIPDKLDYESQALPTVAYFDGEYHMFFCYRHSTDFRSNSQRSYRIGYASSKDLITWNRDDALVGIDVTPGAWDSDMLCYPHAFQLEDKLYMLYNGNEFGRYGFGLAELVKE